MFLNVAFSTFNSDQESCSDNNAGCTHGCIQGPFGAQCSCPVGYQLSNDSKTCEDVDECNSPGLCSQHCFNERGSFRCHCQDGYTLEADQRTCKASGEKRCAIKPSVHATYCSPGTTYNFIMHKIGNRTIISPTVTWLSRWCLYSTYCLHCAGCWARMDCDHGGARPPDCGTDTTSFFSHVSPC